MMSTRSASTIKYIALNPAKGKKFVTKGINLNMRTPVGAVPPDLDEEFMARIRDALVAKEIFEVPEGEFLKIGIAGQGQIEQKEDSDECTVADYGRETLRIQTNPRTGQQERVVNHIFKFRGETEEDSDQPKIKQKGKIIMTGIDSEHNGD